MPSNEGRSIIADIPCVPNVEGFCENQGICYEGHAPQVCQGHIKRQVPLYVELPSTVGAIQDGRYGKADSFWTA